MGNANINMMSEMIDILENDIDKHDIISIYAKLLIVYKWAKPVISDFISFILQDSEEDCQLFSRVEFNSDVILDVEIIPESGFKLAKFNKRSNGKLIINKGCKEIKEHAFNAFSCKNIYLPSTLTRFEYSELSMVKNVYYDGTKSEFIKLLDTSEWWDVVDSVGSDVYCVDDRIRWNEVII